MKIYIGGDMAATNDDLRDFINGDVRKIVGDDLLRMLEQGDINIFNIESPLTDSMNAVDKEGPCLKQPQSVINGIKGFKPDLVTLANNHIMDYGKEGFHDAVKVLNENQIKWIGVGENLQDAREHASCIMEKEDIKIGVYGCTQHEFSAAYDNFPGANPYDPLETFDDISSLKNNCDFLIVIYHGGQEYYQYPSPELQRIFHKMADKGADLVVLQHSHCIGCYELYNDKTLIYGQGNFVFNNSEREESKTGLLLELEIEKVGENVKFQHRFIPIRRYKQLGVRLAEKDDAKLILDGFEKRTLEIKKEGRIEELYHSNAEDNLHYYLRYVNGKSYSYVVRFLDRLTNGKYTQRRYKKRNYLSLYNVLKCEAHNELIKTGIEIELGYHNR